jgi:hypothetical protein
MMTSFKARINGIAEIASGPFYAVSFYEGMAEDTHRAHAWASGLRLEQAQRSVKSLHRVVAAAAVHAHPSAQLVADPGADVLDEF